MMTFQRGHARLAALICLLMPRLAAAQSAPPAHEGVSIGFGVGAGRASLDCSRCGDLTENDPWRGGWGAAGYFSAGYWVHPRIRLAGEVTLWVKRSSSLERDATLASAAFVAHYQPAAAGLDLAAGIGPAGSVLAGGPGLISSNGWATVVGAGYDIRTHARVTVSPYVRYVNFHTAAAAGDNRGLPATGPANPSNVQVGLGFRWR